MRLRLVTPAAPNQQAVGEGVDCDNHQTQPDLIAAGEIRRVHDRYNVMIDKATGVTVIAGGDSQLLFQRGQRAYPAGKFDQSTPGGTGQMQPRHARPLQHHQTAKNDKKNKRKVNQDNKIGENLIHDRIIRA